MKIAYCVNLFAPSIGGSESVSQKIIEYYSLIHDVAVFTRSLSSRKKRTLGKVKIFEYDAMYVSSFLKHIKRYNPDIVFVYSDVFDFLPCVLDEFKNKIIFALCGASRLLTRSSLLSQFRKNVNNILCFVCHSRAEKDFSLISRLVTPDRIKIIPCGVDLEEFDNNNLSREDIVPQKVNKKWVLSVSNFFPGKGQIHLVDILERSKLEDITYVQVCATIPFTIGQKLETEWKNRCSKLLSSSNINIVLMKNKPREHVVAAFKNSNVFAFTSEKESYGLVFLESMAAGIPWISTNIGIASEIKGGIMIPSPKDNNSSSIFDNRTVDFFAEKLKECLVSPGLGIKGREDVEKYQWKNILPEYGKLL